MSVLVTGGAGFVGTHLVRRLQESGEDVVVLDSLQSQVHGSRQPAVPSGVRLVEGSVGDAERVDEALAGVDRVIHLAAVVGVGQSMYRIADYVRENSLGTAVLLERIVERRPQVMRLVVASSMSIYGEGEYACPEHGGVAPPPRSEQQLAAREWEVRCPLCGLELAPAPTREQKPLLPTSVYAVTKRDHEELCLITGTAYEIPTVALRFFNVYGPGQALSNPYTGVAAIFAARLLNGRPPLIFEDGAQSRDFIHVDDIVTGILLSLEEDEAVGRAVNLGTGRPTTVDEVAAALGRGLGTEIEPLRTGRYRAGDIRHCFADASLARDVLGFEPSVGLEDGMGALAEWLSGRDAVDRVDRATEELLARGLAR